jgi:hypothetical protein
MVVAVYWFQAVEGRTARAPVHVILMLDTLNNSFQNVAYERKAIEKYLGQNQGHLSYPVSIALLSDSGVDMGQSSRVAMLSSANSRNVARQST